MSGEPKTDFNKSKDKDGDRKNIIVVKFSEYRAEFRKIVWPSREVLFKHTVTTIIISLIFGVFITLLDGAFNLIFNAAVNAFTSV